jgi:pentatricopeptide repeat protein
MGGLGISKSVSLFCLICKSHVISFASVIKAFCKNGKIPEAVAILDDMIYKDVVPNAHVYNSIIDAYIESGDFEQAFFWLRR